MKYRALCMQGNPACYQAERKFNSPTNILGVESQESVTEYSSVFFIIEKYNMVEQF